MFPQELLGDLMVTWGKLIKEVHVKYTHVKSPCFLMNFIKSPSFFGRFPGFPEVVIPFSWTPLPNVPCCPSTWSCGRKSRRKRFGPRLYEAGCKRVDLLRVKWFVLDGFMGFNGVNKCKSHFNGFWFGVEWDFMGTLHAFDRVLMGI